MSQPLDLRFRAREPEDTAAFNRLMNQSGVVRGVAQMPYRSTAWRTDRLKNYDRALDLLGFVGDDLAAIGGINRLQGRESHVGSAYLAVDEAFQGKGVGRRMMQEVLDFADNWLPLKRIRLELWADNPRALALYESLGFKLEGREVAGGFHGGKFVDGLIMGRVKDDL